MSARRLVALLPGLLAFAGLCLLAAPKPAAAVAPAPGAADPLILVVDVSGSMDEEDDNGTRKIDGAKLALLDYLDTVEPGSLMGLRTYPDQRGGSCNSGRVAIPIGEVDPQAMSAQIRKLQPDGDTPTAEALRAAVRDLRDQGQARGTLVIVSDGESNCDDPCEAAREIRKGGFDLQTLTVGFRISDEGRKELQCISDELGGRYLDIDQSEELRDTLDRLGRPRIEVALDGGSRRTAIAGGDEIEIAATVTNSGEVEAQDVIGQLTFRVQGADVRRPVVHLGNLAPHASRQVVWKVRAGPAAVGQELGFVVVGRALNASSTGVAQGILHAIGVTTPDEAGDIVKGPGGPIAILGDSYSSGEGADRYDAGTDTDQNGCHRSQLTYLIPRYPAGQRPSLLACSGALIDHIAGPDTSNHAAGGEDEPAQLSKLDALERSGKPPKAVVMTIGGNDARFGDIGTSCISGRRSCLARIFSDAPIPQRHSEATDDVVEATLGLRSRLHDRLVDAYEAVNGTLNDERRVSDRGGVAPILVLAYPLPIPLQGRACAPMGAVVLRADAGPVHVSHTVYLLDTREIDFLVDFGLRLNAQVEAAVRTARAEGVPVFFVPSTERAFQPSHTLCDAGAKGSASEPFARSLDSYNGAGLNRETLIELIKGSPFDPYAALSRSKVSFKAFRRGFKEIAHPNVAGYDAVTLALLRWTRSNAAADAVAFTRAAKPADPTPLSWNASDVNLGQLAPAATPTLQGGTSYPLTVGGFAPGSAVQIELHSTPRPAGTAFAGAGGRIRTRVAIPRDLADGRHALVLLGRDAQGDPRRVAIAFEIDRPFRPSVPAAMAAGSGLALLLGLLLTWRTGALPRRRRA